MLRKLLVLSALIIFSFTSVVTADAQITEVKKGVRKGVHRTKRGSVVGYRKTRKGVKVGVRKTNRGLHKGWTIGKRTGQKTWRKGKGITKGAIRGAKKN